MSAWVGLAELALGGCTTSTDHLYVHPAGGGDLISRRDRGRPRARHALPPDPRVDVPVAEGRRPAARLGGAGRRRRSSPTASGGRPAPRPRARGDGAGRAGPVLAVLGDARAHAADRRAGRAARRPPAHPPGRGPRRGHATASRRSAAARSSTSRTCGWGTDRSWVAHCIYPDRDGDRPARALGHGRGPLPELEHDDRRRRHRPGRRPTGRRACPSGWAATARRRPTAPRCGSRPAGALLLGRLRGGPASFGARDALELGTRGSAACLGRHGELGVLALGAAADLVAGSWTASRSPGRSPTRSRRGCAAGRWPPATP